MLTPTQTASLKAFILSTPSLAALVSAAEGGTSSGGSQDGTIVDLINATDGGTITLPSMSKHDLTLALIPLLLSLGSQSAAIQGKYDRILDAMLANDPITVSNANVQAIFAAAIADGLLSPTQAQAVIQRDGTKPESLFGAGMVIELGDVSLALRGR
jgi:hypothetical protein